MTSRVLRGGALACVLPTLLLTPLQAEVILLHRHCDGEAHVHYLEASDLRNWPVRHAQENACCDSGEAEGIEANVVARKTRCEHDRPSIVIATGPFLATQPRLASAADGAKAPHPAVPPKVFSDPLVRHATPTWISGAADPTHAPRDATATLLLRNHALLF